MQAKTLNLYVNKTLWRSIAGVIVFTLAMILAAKVKIYLPFNPVPITMQLMVVVLSGLVLGARGGAASQIAYLGLIAINLPVDTNGIGAAAFFGPTAGYLVGFVLAAYVAGFLAERLSARNWWGNFAAALAGVVVIYLAGASWLAIMLGSWQQAWIGGVAPFILADLGKSAIAAGVAESGKFWLRR